MTEQDDKVEISYVPDEDDSHEDEKEESHHGKKAAAKKKHSHKDKDLHKELKEKEKLLESAIAERDEYKDKYLRNLAEIDNFRKRVKKEKEEYQKYVLSEFLLDLLQIYDNLERALKAKTPSQKNSESVLNLLVSEDEKSIISGVEMIFKQFSELLKKYNVIEIDALGNPFDPNLHQALSKEEREGIKIPVVVEVYQKGFMYNNKLLKPTLVKVAIPMEAEEKETPANEDSDLNVEYQEDQE